MHDSAAVCEALGFAMEPGLRVKRLHDGRLVGRMAVTFEGRTLFAKCNMHAKCTNLVNIKGRFSLAEACQTKWLIAGSACTDAEHEGLKQQVKDELQLASM